MKQIDATNSGSYGDAFFGDWYLIGRRLPVSLSRNTRNDISNHLLDCLKDEEEIIRSHANKLLTLVDPSLVLPALVNLVYSSEATLHSSAKTTLLGVLTYNNEKPEVISMLLDCLSWNYREE